VQKTAEPTEMWFGTLRQVDTDNMYYMGYRCSHGEGALFRVSGRLKSSVNHRILGV